MLDTFCTSLVVGKDAVSRGTVNNLSRLMDEMVTALARCRYDEMSLLLLALFYRDQARVLFFVNAECKHYV